MRLLRKESAERYSERPGLTSHPAVRSSHPISGALGVDPMGRTVSRERAYTVLRVRAVSSIMP